MNKDQAGPGGHMGFKDLMADPDYGVARLAGRKVLIVGDVMLDHYLIGRVERISPEAPVPVVQVAEEHWRLGGAGNVAKNIQALGGAPALLGLVGDDEEGRVLGRRMAEAEISATLLADPGRPTTRKTRIMAHNQQVVRVDRESTHPVGQDVLDKMFAELAARIDDYRVIIVSDYGKGIVSKPFMAGLKSLLDAARVRPMVLVDPKVKNFHLYEHMDLLTPNAKEAREGSGKSTGDRNEIIRAGLALFKRLKLRHLLITLGAGGMALFESPENIVHIPTLAKKVFDVTGAGDTVIAVIALGLAAGYDVATACILANYAAGIVVGQVGAAQATRDELIRAVRELPEVRVEKWL